MRALVLMSLLSVSVATPALAASADDASLGTAAITSGNWESAEREILAARDVSPSDPARLINLGKIYMATNRSALAIATWQKALAQKDHYMVQLADGSMASTADVARTALERYKGSTMAAR